MTRIHVEGAAEHLSILDTYTSEDLVAALKWLDQIGAISPEPRKWFIGVCVPLVRGNEGGLGNVLSTVTHSRTDCQVVEVVNGENFLIEREYKISAPEFEKHPICRNCGADFLGEDIVLGGQICLLHRADLWQHQVVDKTHVRDTQDASQAHGMLTNRVTEQMLKEVAKITIHPALQHVHALVLQNIADARKTHPYTDNGVINELTLLGAKAALRRTAIYDLENRWEIETDRTQDAIIALVDQWLNTMKTLGGDGAEISQLHKSPEYCKLLKTFPLLTKLTARWEAFHATTMIKATKMGFFVTTEQSALQSVPTKMWSTAVRTGIKAQSNGQALGELPVLAIAWLARNATRIPERHRQLTAEQWQMAISLYVEHYTDITSVYHDAGKAIVAASKL